MNITECTQWLRGWLPLHIVRYLDRKRVDTAIAERKQLGYYWTVPTGYDVKIVHKQPCNGSADPHDMRETIGIKFTPKGKGA